MKLFASILICFGVLVNCGCGSNNAKSPASAFDKTHGGKTITPHGEIVKGSAKDQADGQVYYKTEDGREWNTKQQPDGSFAPPKVP